MPAAMAGLMSDRGLFPTIQVWASRVDDAQSFLKTSTLFSLAISMP
jgi:hypothetical protein